MKTPRSERDQAVDAVKRLAMAYPGIAFTVSATTTGSCCASPPKPSR
jgi:DNA mismatch repair ATPase MutL